VTLWKRGYNMHDITTIELILEDFTSFIIPSACITTLQLSHKERHPSNDHGDKVLGWRADGVVLGLSSAVNVPTIIQGSKVMMPFDRIRKYEDITHIQIDYIHGKSDYITVPWPGESDISNDIQHSIVNRENGDLEIEIG